MQDTASGPPKTVVTAKTVVIFGGRSEIGLELACRLAAGSTVVLAARGADRLDDEVAAVRSADTSASEWSAHFEQTRRVVESLWNSEE